MKKILNIFNTQFLIFLFYLLFIFILILLSYFPFPFINTTIFASEGKTLIINKIKIIIDGQLYEWEKPENIPAKNENNYTAPTTIISFIDIKPQDSIESKILEQKLFNIEKSLINSGYFFNASAYFVESSRGENYVNIIIEVTEGFLLRFGGGSIFGVFGKDNLFGLRKGYMVALGYNLDGIKYYDHLLFNSDFIFAASLFYQNGYGFSDIAFDKIVAELTIGYRFKPNLSLSLISLLGYQDSYVLDDFESFFIDGQILTIKESLKFEYNYYYFLSKENKSDLYLRGKIFINPSIIYYFNITNQNEIISNSFSSIIYLINFGKLLMLETKYLSTGFYTQFFYTSKILDYFNSYNLSYSENPFIRAPVSKTQSFPDILLVTNFEIRSPEVLIALGGVFNFVFSIFIFDDFAFCKFLHKNPSSLPSNYHENDVSYIEESIFGNNFYLLNAAGIGIRFGFAMPINVYFTLTYGINTSGVSSFILFYGKGF